MIIIFQKFGKKVKETILKKSEKTEEDKRKYRNLELIKNHMSNLECVSSAYPAQTKLTVKQKSLAFEYDENYEYKTPGVRERYEQQEQIYNSIPREEHVFKFEIYRKDEDVKEKIVTFNIKKTKLQELGEQVFNIWAKEKNLLFDVDLKYFKDFIDNAKVSLSLHPKSCSINLHFFILRIGFGSHREYRLIYLGSYKFLGNDEFEYYYDFDTSCLSFINNLVDVYDW